MLYHLFRVLLGGEHYAYENPLFRATLSAIFCFFFVVLTGPYVIRQLIRFKVGDRPEFDHATLNEMTANKSNVPTMGGILIIVALGLGILIFADVLNFYVQMGLICLVWLGVLGGVDDWLKLKGVRSLTVAARSGDRSLTVAARSGGGRSGTRDGLKSYEKLLFQIGLGVLLGFFVFGYGRSNVAVVGGVGEVREVEAYRVLMVPFYKPGLTLGTGAFMLVTVLVVTGTSNAVNLTDGMDGLASGCVGICCVVLMILTVGAGSQDLATKLLIPHIPLSGELSVIAGSMMGCCMGFLWHNCHPAKVFMGDTGSLPLGGMIGYIAIVTRLELMLLLIGAVFVMEAGSVMLQVGYFKWTRGKRLFLMAPIHHHFQLAGWTESQTVIRFWLMGAMCAVFALATVKLR